MPEKPKFFNWSLKNLLSTIADPLEQSRVKILFTFLIFSILKVLIVIPLAYQSNQLPQFKIAIVLLIIYTFLTKLLLSHRKYSVLISHIMIILGLVIVIFVLFGYAKTINIMAMQFMFMMILSGFYLLNRRFGIFYSILSVIPVFIFMIINGDLQNLQSSTEGMGSPAYEILIFLNFLTIILGHYLFYQAMSRNV